MNRLPTRRLGLVLASLLVGIVAACGGSGAAAAAQLVSSRIVIDVRTAEEYAAGHIAGAQNIDVEAGDFAQKIKSLDPKGAYLVYCRSGRRSAIAADQMAAAGFTDIVDGGGMDALVAAGAPTQ